MGTPFMSEIKIISFNFAPHAFQQNHHRSEAEQDLENQVDD